MAYNIELLKADIADELIKNGFELDWEREQIVARKLLRTWAMFEEQVNVFLNQLNEIDI
jgi:hypothetical protein